MFRLESVSPLVVAWAVSLGLGGLLLMLFLAGDPPEDERPGANSPAAVDQRPAGPAVAAPVASELGNPGQDATSVAKSDTDGPGAAGGAEQVVDDKTPTAAPPPQRLPQPARPDPVAGAKPNPPKQPTGPKAKPKPEPKPEPKPRPAREIEAALELPIVRYVHQKPVAVSAVIREIKQLGGIEVRLDKGLKGSGRLDRNVQLDLSKTTVGGILDAALKGVGLTRRVHDGYVLIVLPANGADPRGTR